MRRIALYLIPGLLLALFVALMMGESVFKRPLNPNEDVVAFMDNLKNCLLNEEWEGAEQELTKLMTAWRKIEPRMQFSADIDEMDRVSLSLMRLEARIEAKDKGGALAELAEAREHWEQLGK